jgi:pimeloyl-ACP methyl ester carboxylesterase
VDIRALLPLITARTLIVGCVDDGLAPIESSRELHAAIPGSSYAELESGRVPRLERPREHMILIRGFLDDEPCASRTGPGTSASTGTD